VRSLTGWRDRRRQRLAGRQLHLVLSELAAHLRAGRALSQAIADVASDMPDPIRTALSGVVDSVALGTSPGAALSGLGLGEDATLLAAAITVQSRTGGDLAMLLDDLADVLVEREGQRRMADAITAQPRATARMVAGMPVAALLLLWLIDRDAVWLLLSSPIGWGALVMSGALTLAGFLLIRRLARVGS
jgi:tight adherence protein B